MVLYFSGTGNGYAVAKEIAKKYKDDVIPMKNAKNDGSKHIIFVFPTYCFDVPKYVREFIEKFEIKPHQKVMGVSVSGGDNGNSQRTFEKLIAKKGFEVTKFRNVAMTDNAICILVGTKLVKKEVNMQEVAEDFWENNKRPRAKFNPITKVADFLFNTSALGKKFTKKKLIEERCIGCEVCASICPTDNIKIENGKAIIKEDCGECFGCIHHCPKQAIYIRKPIDHSKQYVNGSIEVKELNRESKE